MSITDEGSRKTNANLSVKSALKWDDVQFPEMTHIVVDEGGPMCDDAYVVIVVWRW
jgi:hypothetical protein